jgi:hypothetical protein
MAFLQSDPPIAEPDVRRWIGRLEAAAHEARRCSPPEHWLLSLGGTRVRIDAAGPALAAWLRPALAHALRPAADGEQAGAGAFTLTIWDQAGTGIAPPAPFWGEGGWANRGELPALTADGVTAAYHEHAGYLGVFDAPRRQAWVWVRDAARLPRYERAAPLRGPLSWLLSAGGGQLAHAGAVASGHGAALLAGPGGSGKSTTTMACLASGLDYLGDDYVLVRQEESGRAAVHTLYATAKLTERSFDLLPALRPLADGPGTPEDKAVLQLAGSPLGGRVALAAPIVAIVLPRIGAGQDSTWERASASRALTALAPTTVFQLPGAGRASLTRLAALVRTVPAFTLHLGRDMQAIPQAVRAIIAAAAQEPGTGGERAA